METPETTEMIKRTLGQAKRIIGIQPKVGWTKDGKESPTIVHIVDAAGGQSVTHKLKNGDADEFDFVHGCYIVGGKMRDVEPGEDLSWVKPHHVVKDDPKKAQKEQRDLKPDQIPVAYDGLKPGDLVAMPLGGLGKEIISAIHRLGKERGFSIFVTTPVVLKEKRQAAGNEKATDATLLAELIRSEPNLFRPVYVKDLETIRLALAHRSRMQLMRTRVARDNQVLAITRHELFCTDEGGYPEGGFEKAVKERTANDDVVLALENAEKRMTKEIDGLLKGIPIYDILSGVKGMGPLISVAIISDIGDIGRFATPGKYRKYVGLSVAPDGHFPTKMGGDKASWGDKRQPYYRFADMCVYFPKGFWGTRLREVRAAYELKHPQPVLFYNDDSGQPKQVPVQGKWKYSEASQTYTIAVDGAELTVESKYKPNSKHKGDLRYTSKHLWDMSRWKTVQEFAEWLFWKWRRLEGHSAPRLPRIYPPEDAAEIKNLAAEKAALKPASADTTPTSGTATKLAA